LGEVPVHYFTYAASECMMGITTRMESTDNVLIPKSGFYEFLPYNKEGDQRPRCMEELEVGAYYELLVTNFSGLYRYRLNDVVQVTGFCGQAPVLRICFRKNQAVNIAGEKMDLQTISLAVELLARECGVRILEYSVCDEKSLLPGRYQCFVETDEDLHRSDAGRMLDRILMEQNEDYKDLRGLGLIGEASVHRVRKGTHLECRRRFLAGQSNLKPLQYLTDQRLVAFMKERIC
ncbi:MAG: GH3 auxin-responsive promoter family protein, partial [Lachnospiraceae bacterium]|nr:GH3 auxin-responsive promoter family protein [Lachnospiraceae bacterium]